MKHFYFKKPTPLAYSLIPVATFFIASELKAESPANESQWGVCSVDNNLSKSDSSTSINKIIDTPYPDAIYLEADDGSVNPTSTSKLIGNIIIQQNSTVFNADSATINRINNIVTAQGNVTLSTKNLELRSEKIEYDLDKKTGIIDKAEYIIGKERAHGKSTQINQISPTLLQLDSATFTTCPAVSSHIYGLTGSKLISSWNLASSNIQLDQKTQIGHARNVTFNVLDVPVFYFPWLRFPLNNQRLSGFLSPKLRLESSNTSVSIPYYFNLAPNYDATVTLASISSRGYQFDNEFRYLTDNHEGELQYTFMPEDKSYQSDSDDQVRDYFEITHSTKLNKNNTIHLNAENVSDNDYFDDFSTSLETSSRSALQRRLELVSKRESWEFSAAVEDYQILDTTDAPYAKLPELKLKYAPYSPPKSLQLGIDAEVIYFDKEDDTTGSRSDITLSTSKKWGTEAWFFKPGLSLEHSLYSLNNDDSTSISRSIPTLTLDTGLFFDRVFDPEKNLFASSLTQTLEPRLLYTYTPYKDQSDIPIFDTAESSFSETTQLFSSNRFTGKDRIGDANQLTFAVGSKIQDRNNGRELLKASIGQIFYFSDRKVTLPDGEVDTDTSSNLVLELSGRLNDQLQLSSIGLWDFDEEKISSYEVRLNYQDRNKRILNLEYRDLEDELNQVRVSGALPIDNKWSVVASVEHDLKNDRNLESLLGIEYRSCCVKTRLVAKRYLTSDNETYETPIFLEFELKGLGNIGTGDANNELKDKIYGYDDY